MFAGGAFHFASLKDRQSPIAQTGFATLGRRRLRARSPAVDWLRRGSCCGLLAATVAFPIEGHGLSAVFSQPVKHTLAQECLDVLNGKVDSSRHGLRFSYRSFSTSNSISFLSRYRTARPPHPKSAGLGNTSASMACVSVVSRPLGPCVPIPRMARMTVVNSTVRLSRCIRRSAIPAAKCVLPVPGSRQTGRSGLSSRCRSRPRGAAKANAPRAAVQASRP